MDKRYYLAYAGMMPKFLFGNNKYAPKVLLWHELLFLILLDKRFYLIYINCEHRN